MTSPTLHIAAVVSLSAGILAAAAIAIDLIRHRQKMAVMNFVWPLSALFGHVLILAFYAAYGRSTVRRTLPFGVRVAKGTLHCGAGCALGDLASEWLAFALPATAIAFGWGTLFEEKTFAVWVLDYIFAFAIGIAFQYAAIVPMRHLRPGAGLVAAVKADAASLTAWQIGMYGAMALMQFVWLPHLTGTKAPVDSAEFWFAMQLAMVAGFVTSYPVNAWLIRSGLKEAM